MERIASLIWPFADRAHFEHWRRLLSRFVGVQMLVQAIGMISGLLLVRMLTKPEYALFTIANTMLATMVMLSDTGVSSGMSAIGGRVHADRFQFGNLVSTALSLRRVFGLVTLLIVTPVMVRLLNQNGAEGLTLLTLAFVVILSFWIQLKLGIFNLVLRLALKTNQIQTIDIIGSTVRLTLLTIAALIFLNTSMAILMAGAALGVQLLLVRRWIPELVDVQAPSDPEYRSQILSVARRQLPNTLYFCFQGQLSVWLISIFGNTQSVAEVGALGRLAGLFTIATSCLSALVFPRFARCREVRELRSKYWQVLLGVALLGAALLAVTASLPDGFLWLLGKNYSHLRHEVVLMVAASVLSAILGAAHGMNSSRGWILPFWITVSTAVSVQVVAFLLFDVSTVRGVMWMNCLLSAAGIIVVSCFAIYNMNPIQNRKRL